METATLPEQVDDWQERLTTDKQGSALRELRDHLASKQAELRRMLNAGTSPEEYGLQQKLLAAVEAADSAALTFWEKYNKD
jgi:transposase-like protein